MLENLILDVGDDWDDLKKRVKNKLLDKELDVLPGFDLLPAYKQNEYIEEIARKFWNNSYSIIAGVNWAVGRKPFAQIEDSINNEILDKIADKVLKTKKYEGTEGYTEDCITALDDAERREIKERVNIWLRRQGFTNGVPDKADYDEDLEVIFRDLEELFLRKERENLLHGMETFTIGIDVINEVFQGTLRETTSVEEGAGRVELLLGLPLGAAEEFKVAYKMFVEDFQEVFGSDPSFSMIKQAFGDIKAVGSIDSLLYEVGDGNKEKISAIISRAFVKYYMAHGENREDLKTELRSNLLFMISEAGLNARLKISQKETVQKVLDLISEKYYPGAAKIEFDSFSAGRQRLLLDELSREYTVACEVAGYDRLDEISQKNLVAEYCSYVLENAGISTVDKAEKLKSCLLGARFETMKNKIVSIPDISIRSKQGLKDHMKSIPEGIVTEEIRELYSKYWSEVYGELFLEGNKMFKGFNLLPEEKKVEIAIMYLGYKGRQVHELEEYKKSIKSTIYSEIEIILQGHKIIEKGIEIIPYNMLDLGSDSIVADSPGYMQGFKALTIEHFLDKCYDKDVAPDVIKNNFIHSENNVKQTLDRTAKRFFTFYLTTEFDDVLYNLIDKLARGDTITDADYIQVHDVSQRSETGTETNFGLANEILKKAISQLEAKFSAEESKYLRRALADGESLESLLRRDDESRDDAKTRLMGILSSGFGVEMFGDGESNTLFSSVDELLFRGRSKAVNYLMTKAKIYSINIWPKEEIYWLDPDKVELLYKTYVEEALCKEPSNISEWKRNWQHSIQISKQSKAQYLDLFEEKLSAYEMDGDEKSMWMEKAKKEILYKIKNKMPITLGKIISELVEQKDAQRRREVADINPDTRRATVVTGREDVRRSSFLDRIKKHDDIIERVEKGRKKLDIGSGGVERNTSGIIQKAAKKATVTMALEHYYDVLFQLTLGLIELKRGIGPGPELDSLNSSITELLSVLKIEEDKIDEFYKDQKLYEEKRSLYVSFQPENILEDNVRDNAAQIDIKRKIRELTVKNDNDSHRLSGNIDKKQRTEINRNIRMRDEEISELYLELNYENQRVFFSDRRNDFNENVLEPASKSVSNRHVLAFLSSISQAFSATATIDFVDSAVGIYERLQPGYSRRYDEDGKKVKKGIVGNVIDAVLEDEVPKMIYQLYEEQTKPYLYQVQSAVDALKSLGSGELEPGERREGNVVQGSAYEAVYDGVFSLLKSVVSGDTQYDIYAVSNLVARANRSYVAQVSESCSELLKGLRKIANSGSSTFDVDELNRLIISLEQSIASIKELQSVTNAEHDGVGHGVVDEEEQLILNMSNLRRQVEIADRIVNSSDDLRQVVASSKNIDLHGILSVYTSVTDGLTDFKHKINLTEALYRELYQRKADAPNIQLKDEPEVEPGSTISRYASITASAIKGKLLLAINSAVSDASAKYKVATNKRVLEQYVKDMSPEKSKLEFAPGSGHRYHLSPLRTKRKHSFLRGLFIFAQKVSYFFKYCRIPTTKEIQGNEAKKLTTLFHNEYQKKQLKSKTNILMNSARLLSTFNDGEREPTQRYFRTVIDHYSIEPKLYARSTIDENGEMLAKFFPGFNRVEISDKASVEDRIKQQKDLEEKLKVENPEQYAKYIKEVNERIPKQFTEDEEFAEEFSSLEFSSLKKHFHDYTGARISPKENKELLEHLQRLKLEKQQLTEEFKLGRRRPGGRIKRYKYDQMMQDLDSKISVICGQMANNSMVEFSNSMENAFNRDIFKVESERLKDPRVLKDQRQVGLVAVKQLFEYDLTNDITNSALRAGDKALSSSDGSVSVGSEVGSVINSYAEGADTDDFKAWAQDITGNMIESGLRQPLTYVKALSDKYEVTSPQVQRQDAVPTMEKVAREYRARLDAADSGSRGVQAELRELAVPTEGYIATLSRKLQEIGVSIETTVDSVVSRLERGMSDPAAMEQGSFKRLFTTMQNSFADQTMIIADAVDKLFTNLKPNEWLEDRGDIAKNIKSLNTELGELKSARAKLSKLWSDHKHEMSKGEEKALLDRIHKMDKLRSKISSEISKQVQELCYSAPDNADTKILESLCLIRWADCYVDFYRVVLEQTQVAVEELCLKRQAINTASPESLPEGLLQLYNTSRDTVISELGKVVASSLNSEPLHQLAGYMLRLDAPDRDLKLGEGHDTPTPPVITTVDAPRL